MKGATNGKEMLLATTAANLLSPSRSAKSVAASVWIPHIGRMPIINPIPTDAEKLRGWEAASPKKSLATRLIFFEKGTPEKDLSHMIFWNPEGKKNRTRKKIAPRLKMRK